MRRTTLGLYLSAAVHAVAAAGLWWAWPSPRRVASAADLGSAPAPSLIPEPPPLVPIVDEVLELAIVELPPDELLEAAPAPAPAQLAAAAAPRAEAPRPAAPGDEQISTRVAPETAALGGTTLEPSASSAPADSSRSRLGMRDPLPSRLVMPDLKKIVEARETPVAVAAAIPEELERAGGGTYRSDQGSFTAKVNRDGTVELKDAPNLRVGLAVPSPKALGRGLAKWYEDPYAQTRDRERELERGDVPSGAVDDAEERRKRPKTVTLIKGSFDATDWLMRLSGRDPYWAAKMSFLNRTRGARVEMAKQNRSEMLRDAAKMIREHAKLAWAAPGESAAARRRFLFELWDDCAEASAANEGDAELVEAGAASRRAVIGFIRGHLPAGSADAYSDAELASLNRGRTSRQRFAPYEDAPAPSAE